MQDCKKFPLLRETVRENFAVISPYLVLQASHVLSTYLLLQDTALFDVHTCSGLISFSWNEQNNFIR